MPIHSESRAAPRSDATNQDEQQTAVPTSGLFFSLEKTESDEEEEEQQDQRSPARTHGPAEAREKRPWGTESRQQLLQRTRNRIRRSSLQLQQLDANGGSAVVAASGDDFAEEIESEAAEIRTLIARTTQLWSAVDRAERAEDVAQPLQLQASRSFSASALQTRRASLPAQYLCAENEDSTLGSEEEYAEEDDDTETESVGEMPLQHMNHDGGYATDDELFVAPLRHSRGIPVRSPGRMVELRRLEQGELDSTNSDGGHENEGSEEEGYEMEHTTGDLQGELMDASNRAINASKARAIKNAMLGNLIRLGFRDSITRAALEAGVLEIDHYDSDCELAYVDIFMSLVKMSDEDSSDGGEWVVGRPLEYAPFNSSPLLDLSSGSVDIREQYAPGHHDAVAQQVDWDDEALGRGYAVHLSSEEEDGIEYDESFDSNSALELQAPDEEKVMDPSLFDELVRECRYSDSRCSPTRVSFSSGETQAESSTVTPTASAVARETLADCGMVEQPWDASHEVENGAEKPWRRYCEELIVRNREMQDQVAFARRRIAQLSHNNQKLHLLIDRVERDRDGLLFENDLLQTQLHGYEDHEQDQVSMMKELVMLRKRLNQKEHSIDSRSLDQHHHLQAAYMEELKEWEQLLESTLSHVRSVKEEKALEMQKKLDRQVEEQNELKLCVICLSNEKSILCLPCRHLCLCKTCSSRQEVTKCPICRLEIEEMLAVYS
uniref:RING-type domain-containing protein n=1 Tax=Phytophthora ramorum TaxID=164328 RepID=H3GYG0_PHYRM